MKVKEVAALSGVSVRSLHHYDDIGLLTPERSLSGYRIYSEDDLEKLQRILFFKALDLPLATIHQLLTNEVDALSTLQKQHQLLLEKKQYYEQLLKHSERIIQTTRGEITMTKEERFEGFQLDNNPYREEAAERWGESAVSWAEDAIKGREKDVQQEMQSIFKKYAVLVGTDPASEVAQQVTNEWFQLLNTMGNYPIAVFHQLGEMYVQDERFQKNLNQLGPGVAQFMRDAMNAFTPSKG